MSAPDNVRDVLTPRSRVEGISAGASLQEALRRVGESGHSLVPAAKKEAGGYRLTVTAVEGHRIARIAVRSPQR